MKPEEFAGSVLSGCSRNSSSPLSDLVAQPQGSAHGERAQESWLSLLWLSGSQRKDRVAFKSLGSLTAVRVQTALGFAQASIVERRLSRDQVKHYGLADLTLTR